MSSSISINNLSNPLFNNSEIRHHITLGDALVGNKLLWRDFLTFNCIVQTFDPILFPKKSVSKLPVKAITHKEFKILTDS